MFHVAKSKHHLYLSSYLYHEVSLRFNRLPVLLQPFFPMVLSSPGVPVTLVEAVEKWNHYDRSVGWWNVWNPTQTPIEFLGSMYPKSRVCFYTPNYKFIKPQLQTYII